MNPSSSVRAVCGAALAAAMLCAGCSFDARPTAPDRDRGSGQSAITDPPSSGAAATGLSGSSGTAATAPAPPLQSGPQPSTAGTAAPVPVPRDAAAYVDADADAESPMLDASAHDASAAEDAADAADAAPADGASEDAAAADPVPTGALFGACSKNSDCEVNLVCRSSWDMPAATGYCVAFCGSNPDPASSGCPQPLSGTVKATCQLATGLCDLGSCDQLQCPTGLSCVRTETPVGGGQILYAFVCRP